MPAEVAPSINERAFVRKALAEKIRLDGRSLDAFRSIDIQFGLEYGSVTVSWGKTKVLTKISCEVVAPFPDRKFDGIFQISCELSPMASPAFEAGRANDIETLLARHLETAVRRSRALDTESLCVTAGHSVFAIRADVHVLSSDGALLDAACLCVVTALSHFRRPEVSVHGEKITVHPVTERTPIPLSMLHHPLCVTLNVFALDVQDETQTDEETVLIDATLLESQLSDGEIVITANKTGEVCQVTKRGGVPSDALNVMSWIETGVQKARELDGIMKSALEKEQKSRDSGNLIAELSAENER